MRQIWFAGGLVACAYTPTTTKTETGTDTDVDTVSVADSSTDSSTVGTPPSLGCAEAVVDTVPTVIEGTAVDDGVQPSCTTEGRADHLVAFTAPAAGRYLFDTRATPLFGDDGWGLGYIGVAVLDGCGGNELACAASTGPAPGQLAGSVALELAAGQSVLVVVDVETDTDEFVLEITEPPAVESACLDGVDEDYDLLTDCIDSDCAAAPNCAAQCPDGTLVAGIAYEGSTLGLPDEVTPSCEDAAWAAPDESLAFVPPTTGRYLFEIVDIPGVQLIPRLALTDGCGGAELVCGTSRLVAELVEGTPVTLHVTGYYGSAGPYVLDAREVPAAESACDDGVDEDYDGPSDCLDPDCSPLPECQYVCPDHDLGSTPGTLEETTLGQPYSAGVSCYAGGTDTFVTQTAFTAPSDGVYVFAADAETLGGLAVTEGCGGAELACASEYYGMTQVAVPLVAGQAVIAKVGAALVGTGPVTLTVQAATADEVGTCFDRIDGDADGLVDCVDADCGGVDPGCVEVCDTLADEDGDALVDCLDPDCAAEARCAESCPQLEIADPYAIGQFMASGTTVGAADDYAGSCGGAGASDVTLTYTAPATGVYTLLPFFEIPNPVWYARRVDCDGGELFCATDANLRELRLSSGETVIVVVDGASADDDGWFDVVMVP